MKCALNVTFFLTRNLRMRYTIIDAVPEKYIYNNFGCNLIERAH